MSNPPPRTKRSDSRVLWRGDSEGREEPRRDRPGEILRLVSRAKRSTTLYGSKHPVIIEAMGELHQFLQKFLSSRSSIRLFIHEDTFIVENKVLLEDTLQLYSLLMAFKEQQISAVQIDAGVEPWELEHLIGMINLKADEVQRLGGSRAYLEEHGVQHITVGSAAEGGPAIRLKADGQKESPPSARPETDMMVDPQDAYRAGLRVMDELTYQAWTNFPPNLWKARKVVNYFIDLLEEDSAVLLGIAALRNYDEDTYHHSVQVSILSMLIGSQLNLDRPLLTVLGLAGLLHDIGKIRVPREFVSKPGKLVPEEEEVVRRHTVYGAQILRELPGLLRLAMVVAFEHHANYDLSGYPQIRVKEVPHLLTRIVQVADVFDAATSSRRAYRRPKRPEATLKIILEGAGTIFDPVLAKLSVQVLAGVSRDAGRRNFSSHD
jgi:putative nucleotidyltransferase with HDIG domain